MKYFGPDSGDLSIHLQELDPSSYRDGKDSHSSRSDLQTKGPGIFGIKINPGVTESATSTMKLRRSNSWPDDGDIRDPEMASSPRWVVTEKRMRLFWWTLRYVTVFVVVFVALLIPIILFANDADIEDNDTLEAIQARQYKNLVFFLCLWLEVTWICVIFFDIVGLSLPYLFRFIARYVNSAHQRYWRVFKLMRRPICFLFGTIMCYVSFTVLINVNPILGVNIQKDPNSEYASWDDIIDDVLERLTLWVAFYFLEKVFITYIAVHYHFRRSNTTLLRGKEVHKALSVLYEASLSLSPENNSTFLKEDRIIRNATGKTNASSRVRLSSYLARLHMDTYKVVSVFGNFISDSENAHWMRPGSPYAVIDRAWTDDVAANALATRIWMSLVISGKQGLTKRDIIDVLGVEHTEEADKLFKIIDENETGEIQLRDFIGLVRDTGAAKRKIYRGIADMDHCVNTFDWLCLVILAFVMVFFIVVQYVPAIKQIQSILSSLAIGLSFAIGRTFHHLISGIIFVFFDHPYDTGDVVHISNAGVPTGPAFAVKRQSLLYTVFRRLDNGTDLQISNDQLALTIIENYTRSGINRQGLSLFIDIRTSFKDLAKLRSTLEAFLVENPKDYVPNTLGFSVVSIHELNKMELRLGFTHRNNWSDDKLRAQRSNKFHCALVAACRSIPIYKPGSMLPGAGENGNPMYVAQLGDTMALSENIQKEKDRRQGLRWDSQNQDTLEKKQDPPVDDEAMQPEGQPATTTTMTAEEKKKLEEEQALQRLTQVSAGKDKISQSTGVDAARPAVGLRVRGRR